MARLVDLLQVVRLGEVGPPNLHEERPAEIQELVLLVVHRGVCLIWLEVVCRLLDWTHVLHASFGNKSRTVGDRLFSRSQSANNEFIQGPS